MATILNLKKMWKKKSKKYLKRSFQKCIVEKISKIRRNNKISL